MKKTHDALVIPTGETTSGDKRFPVSSRAAELFKSGDYGCIFVTGGYGGFSRVMPPFSISEAKETRDYLVERGIDDEKIFYDDRSFDTVGNFTYPIVSPQVHNGKGYLRVNPNLSDFEKMMIIGKKGHIWRIKDYVNLIMPSKIEVDYFSVPGRHNNGLIAKLYHMGLMKALEKRYGKNPGAEKVHEFLMKEHPFYSEGWFEKPVLERKTEMSRKIWGWCWLNDKSESL